MRQIQLGILQQRIHLEADVPIIAARLLQNGQKYRLGATDEPVGHFPGDRIVVEALLHKSFDFAIEPPGSEQVGHNNRVGGRTGRSKLPIAEDQLGIDRIEPQLCSRGH